ncbi:hypothetical protein AVEN_89071-1 [Araneus ventricosus]|uniref:Uncharacterized protein n=1 Tax=Araneus ventricosus TaxID=182803 RepID=A0A4Y2B100_ARAVE|nr:hypothetical protein AVEN_89071-1 [Araneus ventricosus]
MAASGRSRVGGCDVTCIRSIADDGNLNQSERLMMKMANTVSCAAVDPTRGSYFTKDLYYITLEFFGLQIIKIMMEKYSTTKMSPVFDGLSFETWFPVDFYLT